MNKRLEEEEIIKLIKEYLEDPNTDNAILIDGEWGSGKTFFVQKKLIEQLQGLEIGQEKKKEIKFIYISTYGIKETKELDNKLFDSIIGDFLPEKMNRVYNIFSKGISNLYDIIKAFKELPNIPKDSVKNLIKLLQDERNYTLIFDDIERCDMPINELLGYINEFVEHRKMKVILIANQKEIAKTKIYSDIELKYIVAGNSDLKFPEKKGKKNFENIFLIESKNTDKNQKIEISELKDRVQTLFGEDLLYNQIKEKLIGTTIYYKPNLKEVLKELVNKQVQEKEIKEYILEKSDRIVEMLESKNHINIRTLKIAINLIEKIFSIILNLDLSMYEGKIFEECKYQLLIYIVYACIKHKEGSKSGVWSEKSEFDFISTERVINEYITGFKFVDEILSSGHIDKERVCEIVTLYVKMKSENSSEYTDPLKILEGYWELEDKEIEENIKLIEGKLKKDIYNKNLYPKILLIMMRVVNIGFDKNILNNIISIMKDNLNKSEMQVELDEFNIMFRDEAEQQEYNTIISQIKDFISEKMRIDKETSINKIINLNEGWGSQFSRYAMENKGKFQSKNEFLKLIDINNLINCIKVSNTKDLSDFRRTIGSIYNFSNIKDYYIEDKNNLEELLKKLTEISEEEIEKYSKSKNYNIRLLKEVLEELIERLK